MLAKWVIKLEKILKQYHIQHIEAFKPYVSDISRYGLHSLHSGGARAAASHGIPDRLFKRHGRWLSGAPRIDIS